MKKLIVGIATVAVLGTGLFAMGGMNSSNGFAGKHKRGGFMMPIMRDLNLSSEQRVKIMDIVQNSFKNSKNPSDAFSENGFDKVKFVQIVKSKRDEIIERKADNIEKIYAILTDEQKAKFLKLIKEKKGKRGW